MAKNLVIVESPAKAKTIEGYLGTDFVVKSSFGHVRDLVKKGLAIDVNDNYKPNYAVSSDKKSVVTELKKLAKDAEMVWLATDEDREGEAISWHLFESLKLTEDRTKRITFNEITKSAVTKAINNPRGINVDLVNAQQARRVLDRLVGFELSPVLWRKVKPSLSAGRVQSVAVRLIVEKERSIVAFEPKSSFKVYAEFIPETGKTFRTELDKTFPSVEAATEFLEKCSTSTFTVSSLQKKPAKKSPATPFTTSTLQQEASRKLGYSVARTMSLAQKLYESGKITYMRTDSVNLSDHAINQAKDQIIASFGGEYANPRKYQTKNKSAQEAHEAIRPTDFAVARTDGDSSEQKLYELIWKRTLASQMADAELERTVVRVAISNAEEVFVGHGELIKFDGFLKVYLEGTDEDEEEQKGILPMLKEGETLGYDNIKAIQRFTRPPARYTEASLVKKLEELGIGRPSTYAPTISTVQKRGYVEKSNLEGSERDIAQVILESGNTKQLSNKERYGADKNKLVPTDIGKVVTDFLVENFEKILDYNFTASVEKQFDEIANGLVDWTKMIDEFYLPFHKNVETTIETSSRASGERVLGEDPETGKPVRARIGRFGPMVQIGDAEDEEKPRFASMIAGQSIDSITLEEALKLFELPRNLGEYKGEEVVIGIGKYGPYIRYNGSFVSIKKANGDDPMTIQLDRAIVLIEEKIEADKNKFINEWDHDNVKVQVLNGRYGPYIKIGKKNHRIPKGTDPKGLTLEDCLAIAEK
ncbi:MAG: DNA topoisomerase I [Crocinitomicaceae bacterium]|nr:DNA topoisomerase I [Crocinitomicaceae bacterium]